jgi:hypothetical protein
MSPAVVPQARPGWVIVSGGPATLRRQIRRQIRRAGEVIEPLADSKPVGTTRAAALMTQKLSDATRSQSALRLASLVARRRIRLVAWNLAGNVVRKSPGGDDGDQREACHEFMAEVEKAHPDYFADLPALT